MYKILITYASRTGSTAGIAKAIGRTFKEEGIQADVYPMQEVTGMEDYDAVIAGSAIQAAQWLPEAVQFIGNHENTLKKKTIAIYSVCMTLAMKNGEKYKPSVEKWIEPIRNLVNPVSEEIFAGILDISKVPSFGQRLKFRISVLLGVWKEGDHRDWKRVDGWAKKIKIDFGV